MKKDNKKDGMSAGTAVAIGAGVAALAAGSYFFFGPQGKKNRGKLSGWMIKMKGEIIEKMEGAQEMTETAYHQIVDSVAEKYLGTSEGVKVFAENLKKQWKGIKQSTKKTAKKNVKKAASKKGADKVAGKAQPKKVAAKKTVSKKAAK